MTRGGGSGIVEGVRSRSGIAMANRCAGDGGTTLAVGEKQPRRGFSSFFFFLLSFFSFYWVWRGVDEFRTKRLDYFLPTLSLF